MCHLCSIISFRHHTYGITGFVDAYVLTFLCRKAPENLLVSKIPTQRVKGVLGTNLMSLHSMIYVGVIFSDGALQSVCRKKLLGVPMGLLWPTAQLDYYPTLVTKAWFGEMRCQFVPPPPPILADLFRLLLYMSIYKVSMLPPKWAFILAVFPCVVSIVPLLYISLHLILLF